MNRKELIEWLEKLRSEAVKRCNELAATRSVASFNYQLGKSVAYRTIIEELEQQEESEVNE
jgi:hypothetical protein